MNIRVLTIILVVLALGIGVFVYLKSRHVPTTTTTGNPFASTTAASIDPGAKVITVAGKDGTTYSVPNFTEGKKADTLPAGTYYHLTDNQETEGDAAQFDIEFGTDNSITIVLLKEPLSASRLAAEAKLRSFFPLTDAQLCSLDTFTSVPASINEVFAGNDLGLSFCPGATKLP